MKKIAVILCILLSLFVFVSCPEPDNAPDTQDSSRDIDFIVNVAVFGEEHIKEISKIEFSYEVQTTAKAMSKPVRFDVPADGLVPVGKIPVKKGESIKYEIIALKKDLTPVAKKMGTITPKDGDNKISIEPAKDQPVSSDIVIKVRNADVTEGSNRIRVEAQTFGAEYHTFWDIDVAEGDFTVIPLTDEFLEVFKTGEEIEFTVVGMIDDNDNEKGDAISSNLRYSSKQKTYVVDRKCNGKPSIGDEGTYEIIVNTEGNLIADISYVICSLDVEDLNKGYYEPVDASGKSHHAIELKPGQEVTLYVQVFEKGYQDISDIVDVKINVPEDNSSSIEITPTLISYGKITIIKPKKSQMPDNRLHFSVCLVDEKDEPTTNIAVDGAVPTWEESKTFYIESGRYHFSSQQYIPAVTNPLNVASVVFELAPKESVSIHSHFENGRQAIAEVVREDKE